MIFPLRFDAVAAGVDLECLRSDLASLGDDFEGAMIVEGGGSLFMSAPGNGSRDGKRQREGGEGQN